MVISRSVDGQKIINYCVREREKEMKYLVHVREQTLEKDSGVEEKKGLLSGLVSN